MKFYKILNENERHYGMSYRTGLNKDILDFDPSGSCTPGGIYFAREDILEFIDYGPWIREVTLPEGASVYRNPGTPIKWKADKVFLGERRRITDKIVNDLIAEGAKINVTYLSWVVRENKTEMLRPYLDKADETVFWRAVYSNSIDCVRLLVEYGMKPWPDLLHLAMCHGNIELVKIVMDAATSAALVEAARDGHTEIVKLLLEHGLRNNLAIYYAVCNGHRDIIKLLAPFGVADALAYAKRYSSNQTIIERLKSL